MPNRPNILFIVLDTLRRDHLSGYGYHRETSPELDRFAQDATIFRRAVAPAQWTIPSHASMFTGLYPGVHGVTEASQQLSGLHPTLAEILQVSGYHTVAFCNNPMVGVLNNGFQRGFDQFYNYSGASPNRPTDVTKPRFQRMMAQRFRRFARYASNQFAHSDTLFRISLHPWLTPLWTRFINYKGHTERSINDLMDYWQQQNMRGGGEPTFYFVNLMGAHLPYRPPIEYLQRVAPEWADNQHAFQFVNHFNADAARWGSPPESDTEDWHEQVLKAFYDAEILYQDEQLGRLFTFLNKSGELQNTVVIITADHGESHGDHQLFGHGFGVYQELVHVPLIIHYPEWFPTGKEILTNVSTRRIFHTILDVLNLKPPIDEADPNADVKNLSLHRATNGRHDTEANTAFSEAYPPRTFLHVLEARSPSVIDRLALSRIRRGVYAEDYKLTVIDEQVEALFELDQDPLESHNVARSHTDIVASLQNQIEQFTYNVSQYHHANHLNANMDTDVAENLRALGYMD